KRSADGYVQRVDLRLRPSPEVTPIVLPVNAAISHYESSALPWERAAFIRARACAGDVALGDRFLRAIQPFVWRRSLDFGVIEEVRQISGRIRDHFAQRTKFAPGYDLKRGRGGIREVEFFVQIQQMIHGGRDRSVRAPATLDGIEALVAAEWLDQSTADELADSYRLLRTIEHRVQMVEDAQTHLLPPQPDALEARLPALLQAIAAGSDPVHAINRLSDIVERLSSGVNLFRLLEARPALARLFAKVLAYAPALSDQLARRPELFEGLFDATSFEMPPPPDEFAADLERTMRRHPYDVALDRARRTVNERRFALGVQLIDRRRDPLEVALGYARVAEGTLLALGKAAVHE